MSDLAWTYRCVYFVPPDCGSPNEDEFDYVPCCPNCHREFKYLSNVTKFCPDCGAVIEKCDRPTDLKPMIREQLKDFRQQLQRQLKQIDAILSGQKLYWTEE